MDPQAVDQETRLEPDDHFALKLWLRILTCSNLIESSIRHQLRRDFDCTLPRFDLLAQLDRADGLKMSELSQRLMVTGGNVTGLADQLQQEGWLVREPVANDRRATRLRLTDAGRHRFEGMARTHEQWVVDLLGTLSRDEQRQLHALLGKLKGGLRIPPPRSDTAAPARTSRARKPEGALPLPPPPPPAAPDAPGTERAGVEPNVRAHRTRTRP
jgi:DNA-binding MarR family transcriptional regulator